MTNPFVDHPILNSPYTRPTRHGELDKSGQPTQRVVESHRIAEFITPIPKGKKRKTAAAQPEMTLGDTQGLSKSGQEYDPTSNINYTRGLVDVWRELDSKFWQVTPDTSRLLQYWRHHEFGGVRPFFCQIEAVETAIWLTEVAPQVIPHDRSRNRIVGGSR